MEKFSLYSLKDVLELTFSQILPNDLEYLQNSVLMELKGAYQSILKNDKKLYIEDKMYLLHVGNKYKLYANTGNGYNNIEFLKDKLPFPFYHFLVGAKISIDHDAKKILNSKLFQNNIDEKRAAQLLYKMYFCLSKYHKSYKKLDSTIQKTFLFTLHGYLDEPKRYVLSNAIAYQNLLNLKKSTYDLYYGNLTDSTFKAYLEKVVKYLLNENTLMMYHDQKHIGLVDYTCLSIEPNTETAFFRLIATINYLKHLKSGLITKDLYVILKNQIMKDCLSSLDPYDFSACILECNYILNEDCKTITFINKNSMMDKSEPLLPEEIISLLIHHTDFMQHMDIIMALLNEIDVTEMHNQIHKKEQFHLVALAKYIQNQKHAEEIAKKKLFSILNQQCYEFEFQRLLFLEQFEFIQNSIDPSILPMISLKNNEYLYESTSVIPAQNVFEEIGDQSCLILSSGGTGKTTSANYLLGKSLDGSLDKVNYYLDLGRIESVERTCENCILKTIMDSLPIDNDLDYTKMYEMLNSVKTGDTPPIFTLLVDGLNEVKESLREKISVDINDLLAKNNIQIILFTRNVEHYMDFHYEGRLLPLSSDVVARYLKKECSIDDISNFDHGLLQVLIIPYFLTKFSSIPAIQKNTKTVSKAYFLNSYYSERNGTHQHRSEYIKFKSKTILSLRFYYTYFLPYIAYQAEKNNEMIVTKKALDGYIADLITVMKSLNKPIMKLSLFETDQELFYTNLLKDLCGTLDVLQKDQRIKEGIPTSIKFSHQYTRDYFASKFLLSLLKNEYEADFILPYVNTYSFSLEICEMLKDLDLKTCISKMLELAAGLSYKKNLYLLTNLFNIWTCNSNTVVIHDFKNMDFRAINLSKYIFSDNNLHSNFENCILNTSQFMPYDSGNILNGAVFHPSTDQRFIVASTDKIIKEFDLTKSPALIHTYISTCGKLENALYSHDGNFILACGWENRAEEYKVGCSGPAVHKYTMHDNIVTRAVYSPNDDYVLTSSLDGTVIEYQRHPSKAITQYKLVNRNVEVNNAYYNADATKFVASYSDGYVREWKISRQDEFHEEFQPLHEYHNHEFGCAYAMYSYDDKKIVSGGADQTIAEVPCGDVHTKNIYEHLNGAITGLIYSKDAAFIYFCSTNSTIIKLKTYPFTEGKIKIIKKPHDTVYHGHVGAVEDIDLMNHTLISAGWDEKVNVYDEREESPKERIRVYNSLYCTLPYKNKDVFIIYSETLTYFILIDLRLSNPMKEIKTDFKYGIKRMIHTDYDTCMLLTTNHRLYSFDTNHSTIRDFQCDDVDEIVPLHGVNTLEVVALNVEHNQIYFKNYDKCIQTVQLKHPIETMYNYDNNIFLVDQNHCLHILYLTYVNDGDSALNQPYKIPLEFKNYYFYTIHEVTYLFAYHESKCMVIDVEASVKRFEQEMHIKQVIAKDSYVVIVTDQREVWIVDNQMTKSNIIITNQIIDLLVHKQNVYGLTKEKILLLHENDTETICNLSSERQSNEYLKMNFNYDQTKIVVTDSDNVITIVDRTDKHICMTKSMRLSFNVKNCLFKDCKFLSEEDEEDDNAKYFLNYYGAKMKG